MDSCLFSRYILKSEGLTYMIECMRAEPYKIESGSLESQSIQAFLRILESLLATSSAMEFAFFFLLFPKYN